MSNVFSPSSNVSTDAATNTFGVGLEVQFPTGGVIEKTYPLLGGSLKSFSILNGSLTLCPKKSSCGVFGGRTDYHAVVLVRLSIVGADERMFLNLVLNAWDQPANITIPPFTFDNIPGVNPDGSAYQVKAHFDFAGEGLDGADAELEMVGIYKP